MLHVKDGVMNEFWCTASRLNLVWGLPLMGSASSSTWLVVVLSTDGTVGLTPTTENSVQSLKKMMCGSSCTQCWRFNLYKQPSPLALLLHLPV